MTPNQKNVVRGVGAGGMLLVGIASQMLSACGSLNTIKYHSPSLENAAFQTERSRDGIAFSVGDICLHISEGGSKLIQPRAMTLVGAPVLPVDLSSKENRTSYFDLTLWLIPERGNTSYMFEVSRIELEFSDGVRRSPNVIQVSRFKTNLQIDPYYFFKPNMIEMVSYPEHWGAKPISDFHEPLALWDWARLSFRFEKPGLSIEPTKLYVLGVVKDGILQKVPVINFSLVSELRQAFPGRLADGTWISDWPDKACRKLQKQEQLDR